MSEMKDMWCCPTPNCGYIYDPDRGDRRHHIPKGTKFEDLPDDWVCPVCGGAVAPDRRQAYCSEACARKAHRRQQREYMRKKRGTSVDN